MADSSNEFQMSLTDFINMPTTTDFYYWYTPAFQQFISERPYIRLGTVLPNELAILYAPQDRMDEIFRELGSDILNIYPEIYGLKDREELEESGIH